MVKFRGGSIKKMLRSVILGRSCDFPGGIRYFSLSPHADLQHQKLTVTRLASGRIKTLAYLRFFNHSIVCHVTSISRRTFGGQAGANWKKKKMGAAFNLRKALMLLTFGFGLIPSSCVTPRRR